MVYWDEIKGGNINCSSLVKVNLYSLVTCSSQYCTTGFCFWENFQTSSAEWSWDSLMTAVFLQHPSNYLFLVVCHTVSLPTTFLGLKLSPTHSTDTWLGQHIVLESSVSRQDWIPKCHLLLSSLFFSWPFLSLNISLSPSFKDLVVFLQVEAQLKLVLPLSRWWVLCL